MEINGQGLVRRRLEMFEVPRFLDTAVAQPMHVHS